MCIQLNSGHARARVCGWVQQWRHLMCTTARDYIVKSVCSICVTHISHIDCRTFCTDQLTQKSIRKKPPRDSSDWMNERCDVLWSNFIGNEMPIYRVSFAAQKSTNRNNDAADDDERFDPIKKIGFGGREDGGENNSNEVNEVGEMYLKSHVLSKQDSMKCGWSEVTSNGVSTWIVRNRCLMSWRRPTQATTMLSMVFNWRRMKFHSSGFDCVRQLFTCVRTSYAVRPWGRKKCNKIEHNRRRRWGRRSCMKRQRDRNQFFLSSCCWSLACKYKTIEMTSTHSIRIIP